MMPCTQRLPPSIAAALAGRETDGVDRATSSTATVQRYTRAGVPDLFLKMQPRAAVAAEPGLVPERAMLDWLDGRLGAPRALAFHEERREAAGHGSVVPEASDAGDADDVLQYLVTEVVPGRSASSGFDDSEKPGLVRLLAEGLRRIHALPVAGCPGDGRAAALVAAARERLHRGQQSPKALAELGESLRELEAIGLPPERLVVTHGDYCLPNIMVDGPRLSGFLDWGYAGIGDAYRDLVAADYSVRRNLGDAWVRPFFDAYGTEPDAEAMRAHRLLYGLW